MAPILRGPVCHDLARSLPQPKAGQALFRNPHPRAGGSPPTRVGCVLVIGLVPRRAMRRELSSGHSTRPGTFDCVQAEAPGRARGGRRRTPPARRGGGQPRRVGAEQRGLRAPFGLDGRGRERRRLDDAGERGPARRRVQQVVCRPAVARPARTACRSRSSPPRPRRSRTRAARARRTGPRPRACGAVRRSAGRRRSRRRTARPRAPPAGRRTAPWRVRPSRTACRAGGARRRTRCASCPGGARAAPGSPGAQQREARTPARGRAGARGGASASATSSGTGVPRSVA